MRVVMVRMRSLRVRVALEVALVESLRARIAAIVPLADCVASPGKSRMATHAARRPRGPRQLRAGFPPELLRDGVEREHRSLKALVADGFGQVTVGSLQRRTRAFYAGTTRFRQCEARLGSRDPANLDETADGEVATESVAATTPAEGVFEATVFTALSGIVLSAVVLSCLVLRSFLRSLGILAIEAAEESPLIERQPGFAERLSPRLAHEVAGRFQRASQSAEIGMVMCRGAGAVADILVFTYVVHRVPYLSCCMYM